MKLKIILILAIFISFHSISRANDISEFEVEGISVGNSLLDFLSKDEIQNNTLPYFENKRKYFIVGYFNNLNKYDQIELYLKSGDKKYIIRSIIGGVFTPNYNKCLNQKKDVVKELDQVFSNIKKISGSKSHEADVTGNSKHHIDQYNLGYPNHIRVECTNFTKEMINSGMAQNSLNIVVMSKEINDWIAGGYK